MRRDDNELFQMLSIVYQRLPQQRGPDVNRHVAEPEQDYAPVGQPVAEDEVAEVFVVGQDDARRLPGVRGQLARGDSRRH